MGEVLIFPTTRRDGIVTRNFMAQQGIRARVCSGPELVHCLAADAGALVLTDSRLEDPDIGAVLDALQNQPAWSDLPIVLLGRVAADASPAARRLASMSNVTLLEKPTSARTLLSAVQTALRARRRQYQIRDAEEALRAASQRKDEFLAMLAHELRNPLASIRNAAELMSRRHLGDGQTQTTAALLKRQVMQLTRLVDDLLDVSRITQGRIELQRRPVSLRAVLAQALESVQPLMQDKNHQVSVRFAANALYASGDAARLVQCVANLLTNSAKYTDAHGSIDVSLDRADTTAVITVTDNGIGIPADLLPNIFELFVQSNRSLDRSQGGLGIGLSVVRRLVDMHGGTVSASSAGTQRGSSFRITLPLVDAPDKLVGSEPAPRVKAQRVLVVDDNMDAALSLAELLKLEGYLAEPVFTSESALERAGSFDADVILLDIGLPVFDGYEVARRLRAGGSRARLVAVTGYGRKTDVEQAMAAGFDAHMLKPVDLKTLEQVMVKSP
ncbi:MAG TPA: hybrid sensor histidine kinase/response regulator [Steroidobacteraceae bacterium]|nr:hybrid sensor histidine kinase/response regulator [Steroidobacteraceae bacterium]